MTEAISTLPQDANAGPWYVGWRADLLARFALVRMDGVQLLPDPRRDDSREVPFDYVVIAPGGVTFLLQVQGFSSRHSGPKDPAGLPVIRCLVPAKFVRWMRLSPTPVFRFLFDADGEHGRFLRLDTLPEPPAGLPDGEMVPLDFPAENAITWDSIEQLLADLRAGGRKSA